MAAPRRGSKGNGSGAPRRSKAANSPWSTPAEYVQQMRGNLLPMFDLVNDTQQDVTGLAAAQLGPATAALMMARNDLKSQAGDLLAPAVAARQGAASDVTGQAMDRIGNVIALGQAADPAFPGIDQIAQQIYPQIKAQLQTPGDLAAVDKCIAAVNAMGQLAMAQCQTQYQSDPDGYAVCVERVQEAIRQGTLNCNFAAGNQGPTGHVTPPPLPPVPPGPKPPVTPPKGPPGTPGGPPTGPGIHPAPTPQVQPPPDLPPRPTGTGGTPDYPATHPAAPPNPCAGATAGPLIPLPAGTVIVPAPQCPGYYGTVMPDGSVSLFPVMGDPDHPFPPGTVLPTPDGGTYTVPGAVTTTTSSSAPPPTAPPGTPQLSCDLVASLIGQFTVGAGSYQQVAELIQTYTNFPTYVSRSGVACDTGYTFFDAGEVPWAGGSDYGYGYCVKCGVVESPTSTSKGCCPVYVTVNERPCPTAPPVSTLPPKPSSGSSSGQLPAGLNLQLQAASGGACVPPAFTLAGFDKPTWVSTLFGLRDANGAVQEIGGAAANSGLALVVINAIVDGIRGLTDNFGQIITKLIPSSGCADPNYVALQITRTVTDLVEKYIGGGLDGIQQKATQQAHNLCPSMLPSPDNAIEAFLTNQIDRVTALCWARAGNQTQKEWDTMIDARQSRLDTLSLISSWRRDFVSEAKLNQELRELGFTDDIYVDLLKKLSDQIPPASDLVSFMVRDVEDPNIVGPFGLDDDFTDKFTGKVKEWAKNQGVGEDYMRRIWRAHWSIPSPTQLFEFWHKLRNDPKYAQGTELYDDIVKALKQQDILPKWVPYYLDSSYRIPTRVDVRRMFNNGSINRDRVRVIYTQGGYDDTNAEALTVFAENERKKAWKKNPLVTKYVKGLLSDAELSNQLNTMGVSSDVTKEIIAEADFTQMLNRRDVCHKAWKKRYLSGELRLDEVRTMLLQDGLNSGTVDNLTAGWQCEKSHKSKTIPAAQACKLFSDGIITSADYYNRLINIGYGSEDALVLVTDCEQQALRKRTAADDKAIKQATAAARRQDSDYRAGVKRMQQKTQQQRAALDKARSISKKRRDLILEGGFNYAAHAGVTPGEAVELVNGLVETVRNRTGATLDVTLEALPKLTKLTQIIDADSLLAGWVQSIRDLGPLAQDPSIDPGLFLPSPPLL